MTTAAFIWLSGWTLSLGYWTWRLSVNAKNGLIANPRDPVAYIAMASVLFVAWWFIMPKTALLRWGAGR